MKKRNLLMLVLPFLLSPASRSASIGPLIDNCRSCHLEVEDDDGPSYLITRDVHFDKGLSCADCHGGDPSLDDMDEVREGRSYRGTPDHLEVPDFCARCHSNATYMRDHDPSLPTDQLQKYKTSVHGQRLFGKKDEKVANCISCHTVHEIASEKMPHSSTHPANLPATCGTCHADVDYMSSYDLPTDQLEKYTKSVHGIALFEKKDLGAAACNDCHGNHGASPSGATSIIDICGNCHSMEADLFSLSPHRQAYEDNDFPMCVTCHGNHLIEKPSDQLIGSKEPALCANCHEGDDGTTGAMTADSMIAFINQLKAARNNIRGMLDEAHDKGMMTVDAEFQFKEVQQAIIQTRTSVHSFNLDSLRAKALLGMEIADSVQITAADLLAQYTFRRTGLIWSSLFISLLAFGLYLRIRRLD